MTEPRGLIHRKGHEGGGDCISNSTVTYTAPHDHGESERYPERTVKLQRYCHICNSHFPVAGHRRDEAVEKCYAPAVAQAGILSTIAPTKTVTSDEQYSGSTYRLQKHRKIIEGPVLLARLC